MQKTYQAAIYLRLSREDGDVTEGSKQVSNSIANQNELVMDYLKSHPEIQISDTYVDDGYSGVDFERPEFQRMLSDIRENKINCVVVKDLSRFGRNYIESGRYIEKIFPMLGIRFIAITDGYDSINEDMGSEMIIPFKNLLSLLSNEIYTGAVVALKSTFDTVTGKLKVKPKEEWSKVEGMHEAIVSKEVFQKAQEMITPQKVPSETRKQHYICGCCGRGLNRRNGTDLYCARGYFLEDDCECRVVKAKEPTLDGIVLKELKEKLLRVMDAEELKLEAKSCSSSMTNSLESLKGALESVKKAKQMLFERLADRSIDRETFKEKKALYDSEILELEQKISDASLAESLTAESDEKMDEVKSFLEVDALTDDMWEKFIQDVIVYPGDKLEIHWNFEEEF